MFSYICRNIHQLVNFIILGFSLTQYLYKDKTFFCHLQNITKFISSASTITHCTFSSFFFNSQLNARTLIAIILSYVHNYIFKLLSLCFQFSMTMYVPEHIWVNLSKQVASDGYCSRDTNWQV